MYLDAKGRIGIYNGTKLKCEHGRKRSVCKECGGASVCEHDMKRSSCKECGGGSICEHDRIRFQCEGARCAKSARLAKVPRIWGSKCSQTLYSS